jgi:hypothetical protein
VPVVGVGSFDMAIMLMRESLRGSLQPGVYKLLESHTERGSDVVYAGRLRVRISSKRRVGATKGEGVRPGARIFVFIDEMSMSERNLAMQIEPAILVSSESEC